MKLNQNAIGWIVGLVACGAMACGGGSSTDTADTGTSTGRDASTDRMDSGSSTGTDGSTTDGPISDEDGSMSTTCDSSNCEGCCVGNTCVSGAENDRCGRGGSQCVACMGTESCRDQECQPPCAETCDGCCYHGITCIALGTTNNRYLCGAAGSDCFRCSGLNEECSTDRTDCVIGGGNPCIPACEGGRTCEGGECLYPLEAMYTLRLISGELPAQTLSGAAWDLPSGFPDPYVILKTIGGDYMGRSSTINDDVNPGWDEVLLENISGTDLVYRGLEVEVFDEDLVSDESMGICIIDNFSRSDLGSTPVRRSCITGAGWTLTFRIDRQR